MQSTRDPRSVRPSLLVFAALFLGALFLVATRVATSSLATRDSSEHGARDSGSSDDDTFDDDHGWSTHVADPGAEGSAREAWAQTSSATQGAPLPPLVEAFVDPQLSRYRASFTPEAPAPFTPFGRRGRIVSARGLDLDASQPCEVRVLPVADSGFNCLVRVMCGGTIVYPNRAQTAGYVACELGDAGPRSAEDALPTVTDGDPSVAFDAARGTVRVRDADATGRTIFDVTLELDPATLRIM